MLCPNCHSVMRCKSEIHDIKYGRRMDLHCFSRKPIDCFISGKSSCYPCHMGVLIHQNQEWICNHYNFRFNFGDESFILSAYPSTPDLEVFNGKAIMVYDDNSKFTKVLRSYGEKPIIQVPFISISTGDDMHLHAKEVFDRLMRLVMFS